MNLNEYPGAIAEESRELLQQEKEIRVHQNVVDAFLLDIERQIAFDKTLTNEVQRKTRKAQLMTGETYLNACRNLQKAIDTRTEIQIQLQRLRDEFAVAKLEARRQVVSQEITL